MLGGQTHRAWVQIPPLPPAWGTLGECLYLPVPQKPSEPNQHTENPRQKQSFAMSLNSVQWGWGDCKCTYHPEVCLRVPIMHCCSARYVCCFYPLRVWVV